MPTELSPSPGLLLYLFADKLAPAAPYKSALAEQFKLAGTLFALAFWSLREQNVLRLQLCAAKKRLAVTSVGVRVSLCSLEGDAAVPALGLEAAILDALRSGHDGESAHSIIHAIAGAEENPHPIFMQRAALEARAFGMLLPGSHEHQLPSSCRCVADLEARADEVLARWREFEASEPLLHIALLKSCASGLQSRREATKPGLPPSAFSA